MIIYLSTTKVLKRENNSHFRLFISASFSTLVGNVVLIMNIESLNASQLT